MTNQLDLPDNVATPPFLSREILSKYSENGGISNDILMRASVRSLHAQSHAGVTRPSISGYIILECCPTMSARVWLLRYHALEMIVFPSFTQGVYDAPGYQIEFHPVVGQPGTFNRTCQMYTQGMDPDRI